MANAKYARPVREGVQMRGLDRFYWYLSVFQITKKVSGREQRVRSRSLAVAVSFQLLLEPK
jgi:hypothetical protein